MPVPVPSLLYSRASRWLGRLGEWGADSAARPGFSAKLRGDKSAIKMEKIRRRTVGHVKTPPRPASSRGAAARKARPSTSRRARPLQPEPQPQPEAEPAEAPTTAATPSEGQVEAKPEEEVRPLERARALRLERKREEQEKRAKEEAVPAEAQPPSAAAPEDTDEGEPAVSVPNVVGHQR